MSKLYVARRPVRKGLYIPTEGTKENPNLIFFLPKTSRSQLDEQIRSQLEKQGVTKESDVQQIVDKAEAEYEKRQKVEEAQREVRRLMLLRAEGKKLMSVGRRKWREAFYPAVK